MDHHHHHHHHTPVKYQRAFLFGILFNVAFVAIEVIYGLAARSSALLADAGHNASDVFSLIFAWAAAWLATKKASGKYTYGYRKSTILVSILNALLLFGAVVLIAHDALNKFWRPVEVEGQTMMVVAAIGVVINTATALLFLKGKKEDLNIRGAFLHMVADAAVSVGVVIAGLLIRQTGALWIDPAVSLIIILVIVAGTWDLLTEAVNLALDAVPKNIQVSEVKAFLEAYDGVEDVHDLHIWAMSTTEIALTAHLVVPNGHTDDLIFDIRKLLHDQFDISHVTLQIESTFADDSYRGRC